MTRFVSRKIIELLQARFSLNQLFMVVSGFYDCASALLKYRNYQKNSVITLWEMVLAVGTISPKGFVQFYSCNKAVAYVFPHEAEPSSATRTGQYLLDCYYNPACPRSNLDLTLYVYL